MAQYPLLTHTNLGGEKNPIQAKFKEHGFAPEIVFSATDCEVIKSYVRMGLGVGIIASMAFEESADPDLVKVPIDHLMPPSLINVVFDRNLYFREYIFAFIESLGPHLSKELLLESQQIKSASKLSRKIDTQQIPVL